ncbi:MAG TPA: hypothetical protein VLV31_02110 [Candidatus Acidoferrales bacterium]|nr:hypothetical protein [Candidatus Acidoferrales bacterium]
MSKDQGYGFAIFIISLIVAIVYLVAFFAPAMGSQYQYLHDWAVGIPVLLFVLLVLVISGWIGWTMLTTPPPAPLEPEPTPPSSSTETEKTPPSASGSETH